MPVTFFMDFENSKWMTSWRPFCTFSFRHSHVRNFALIFFKIKHKVQSCLPMFAFENQQNRLVTSANKIMANRVFEKNQNGSQNKSFEIGQVRYRFQLI